MLRFLLVVLMGIARQSWAGFPTEGTKLISVFLIHRHGDRTPIEAGLKLTTNPVALAAATNRYGFAQVTEVGLRRAYDMGKAIRERYNELISPRFNKSEVYIRSIDTTRAKVSVLTAMAAIYQPYPGSWSKDINWVPTPYTTSPAKFDYNKFNMNCPSFLNGFKSVLFLNPVQMRQYFEPLNIVSKITGTNITEIPIMAYNYYDGFLCQLSLGIPLPKEIEAIMPKLEKAAVEALDFLLGDDRFLIYEAGVLLNEFFNQADDMIYGDDAQRVRIYSAHDLNVYALKAASKVLPRKEFPKYSSFFSLELRQFNETGDYGVLPVYQAEPGAEVKYLTVAGCDILPCPIETFRKLVSEYIITEDEWYVKCDYKNGDIMDGSKQTSEV